MLNTHGHQTPNTCRECQGAFFGYGIYCPTCLPTQDADEVAFHTFAAAHQQESDAYWGHRWQSFGWFDTDATTPKEQ